MEMTSAKYPQKEAASQPQSAPSIRSRLLNAPHGSAGIQQARAAHDLAAFDGRCAVTPTMASADLRSACADIEKNIDVLLALALVSVGTFRQLPADDFFVKKTCGLGDTLRAFVEEYADANEDSLNHAVPIFVSGPRDTMLAFVASAAGLLFQLGHTHIGIAVVDRTGRGVVFQFRSREDVVCREVRELRLGGAVS